MHRTRMVEELLAIHIRAPLTYRYNFPLVSELQSYLLGMCPLLSLLLMGPVSCQGPQSCLVAFVPLLQLR